MSVKNGLDKKCTVCDKEYYVSGYRAEKSKFCSKACWEKRGDRKNNYKCENCNIDFKRYGNAKYCSRECSHSAMVGIKAPRWVDGKSLERDRARLGTKLKEWRKLVFKRDNYTCKHCGDKKDIQAHHIIEWAKDESKRFDVDNGLTLCIDCHGKVHGISFKRKSKNKCECGKEIKRESKNCRKCATIKQWEQKKNTAM